MHTDCSHWHSASGSSSSASSASPCSYYSKDISIQSHCSTDRCVCLHDCLCHLLGSLFYPHLCREDSVPLSRDNPNITASLMLLEMIPVRNAHGSLRTQNASFTAHCVQLQDLSYHLMLFSICIFASFSLGVSVPEKATAFWWTDVGCTCSSFTGENALVEGVGETLLLAHSKCTVWLRVIDSVSLISKTGK